MTRLGRIWSWAKYPVAIGILFALWWFNRDDIQKVARTPKNWTFFLFAILLITASNLLTFVRWYLLVWAQKFAFRVRDAFRLGFIGLVCNYMGPGALGGDLFKAWLLARDQESRRTVAVATVLLDRILGMLALFMVGAAATLMPISIPPELKIATILLWAGSLAGLGGVGLMLLPATTHWRWVNRLAEMRFVGRFLGELIHGVRLYQSQPAVLLIALVISLISHSGLIVGFFCCARWMQQPWVPDLTTHFYFMPNAELFSVLVPVPGGVGSLEAAISWFYEQLRPESVEPAQAAAAGFIAAIAFRVVTMGIAAVGGFYYFLARREVSAALRDASVEAT
ncbi:MAG: lysylphosphatidylglycerol synthase transmembrane domain-containing protein [Planctomycetaceae bacterium]